MTTLLTETEMKQLISEYKNGKKPSDEEIERMRDYYLADPNTDQKIKDGIIAIRNIEARTKRIIDFNHLNRIRPDAN